VAALAGIVAHGGAAGAIVESLIVLAVVALLAAVWFRERHAARERAARGQAGYAQLRDDDEEPQS
jgi:hypothetical protein